MSIPGALVGRGVTMAPARAAGIRAGAGAVWAFSRPHTVVGTTLSLAGVVAMTALPRAPGAPSVVDLAMFVAATWIAAVSANVFIVGLNQLADVAIDRINKPELPLPAGALTRRGAIGVVAASAAVAIGLGLALGPWLLATLASGMLVGAAYSLPPFRLKASALAAPLSIALVRGPIVILGLYAHVRAFVGGPDAPPPGIWLLSLFMTAFALGIGVAKDLPDIDGDRAHAVGNVAARWGPAAALRASVALLASAYALTAVVGLALLSIAGGLALVLLHAGILVWLLARARSVDPARRDSVHAFYRIVWRLFYAQCVLLPAVAVLAGALG